MTNTTSTPTVAAMVAAVLSTIFGAEVIDSFDGYPGHSAVRFGFPNGYALSVARSPMTYGGASGLFEALPIRPDSVFMDDAIAGWLDVADVIALAEAVAAR